MKTENQFFRILRYSLYVEGYGSGMSWISSSEAIVRVQVKGLHGVVHEVACGNGSVNAIDNALRKALVKYYPRIARVRLVGYKVRKINGGRGTESLVEVTVTSSDSKKKWVTRGISGNLIDASLFAVVEGLKKELRFLS